MKAAVIFDNLGPYHLARLRAAAAVCDLLAVEVAASSAEYSWKRDVRRTDHQVIGECQGAETKNEIQTSTSNGLDFKIETLFEEGTSRDASRRELERRLHQVLDNFQPHAVFIPGWSSRVAFATLLWCGRARVPVVVMSESTEWDQARSKGREAAKRRVVGLCSASLVGGTPHRDYMEKLGMPAERVFSGYDAVDNEYFASEAQKTRSEAQETWNKHGLPEKYFLASARFIEKKNLPGLLQAHALYRKKSEPSKTEPTSPLPSRQSGKGEAPWDLVLIGDGALRESLLALRSSLGLDACVHLPGFKQYPDLPAYYGHASAFIHASTTEQWGLVVNEAMASGLPVLVSNRCGCARDLVQEGVNGFTFDPHNAGQLSELMFRISNSQFPLSDFGAASRRIISNWGPERFAQGLKMAVEKSLEVGPVKPTLLQRLLLKALLAR